MGFHDNPECLDCRPNCNNRTESNTCIALTDSFIHCKFYCAIKDTNPKDYEYHIRGLRKTVAKQLKLVGEIL